MHSQENETFETNNIKPSHTSGESFLRTHDTSNKYIYENAIDGEMLYESSPALEVGASVRYVKNDHIEHGDLIGVNISDLSQPPIFTIQFSDGRTVETTRDHIGLRATPDPFTIPTRAKNMIEVATSIPKEYLDKLMNPEVLTPLQQLWLWCYEVLDHLPRMSMNRLVERKVLPKKFEKLRDWMFVCPSCLLAQ